MATHIVSLKNLTKQFGDVLAVDHINLDISSGEFITLLGPSGCGKTTTLRMISGLEMPSWGNIFLEGQDITYTSPEKRPINMVFQAYALFPHMTIAENIAFGPKIKHWPKEKIREDVREMLKLVQLDGFENRKTSQLSGGQAQRVALARALINCPTVLLLDEPLGALDLKLRKSMQLELRNLQKRLKMTFIYVTHDQEEAMVMSDQIVLMDKGHIVQIGKPAEIYNHPASEFVSRFIGEANLIPGVITTCTDNYTEINSSGLIIHTPPYDAFSGNQNVLISLRPEQISLYRDEKDAPNYCVNLYKGKIEHTIFLGPMVRFHIRLENNQRIIAECVTTSHILNFQPESSILIGWDEISGIVLSI